MQVGALTNYLDFKSTDCLQNCALRKDFGGKLAEFGAALGINLRERQVHRRVLCFYEYSSEYSYFRMKDITEIRSALFWLPSINTRVSRSFAAGIRSR